MRQFQAGEEGAFETLFTRYASPLVNFTYRFLGSQGEAEDVAQETFLRVYRNKGRYDASRPFRTWLFSIAARLALNQSRNRKRHAQTSLDGQKLDEETGSLLDSLPDPASPAPEEVLRKEALAQAVKNALATLPENQRAAVLLCRYERMPYEEIARTMGCSLTAIKSLLFRARQTLKKMLAPYAEKAGETTQA